MTRIILILCLILISSPNFSQVNASKDYHLYHQKIVAAESLIAAEEYQSALLIYEGLFQEYEFCYVRDYKIATQLALHLREEEKAQALLLEGIKAGWSIKSIQKNDFLNPLREKENWTTIKDQYAHYRKAYESGLNQQLKKRVKKLYAKDQRKALGALFRIGSKAKHKYYLKRFAPHSEKQLEEATQIIQEYGYPGEKLVGNNYWMSTVLSHHNSISTAYNNADTLYPSLQPQLKDALQSGHLSVFEFATMEEWYRATIGKKEESTLGILEGPLKKDLEKTNKLRKTINLRSIEVHNKLVDIEAKTGMHFYLEGHPWEGGKTEIR